jgi:hypothetical protein
MYSRIAWLPWEVAQEVRRDRDLDLSDYGKPEGALSFRSATSSETLKPPLS